MKEIELSNRAKHRKLKAERAAIRTACKNFDCKHKQVFDGIKQGLADKSLRQEYIIDTRIYLKMKFILNGQIGVVHSVTTAARHGARITVPLIHVVYGDETEHFIHVKSLKGKLRKDRTARRIIQSS